MIHSINSTMETAAALESAERELSRLYEEEEELKDKLLEKLNNNPCFSCKSKSWAIHIRTQNTYCKKCSNTGDSSYEDFITEAELSAYNIKAVQAEELRMVAQIEEKNLRAVDRLFTNINADICSHVNTHLTKLLEVKEEFLRSLEKQPGYFNLWLERALLELKQQSEGFDAEKVIKNIRSVCELVKAQLAAKEKTFSAYINQQLDCNYRVLHSLPSKIVTGAVHDPAKLATLVGTNLGLFQVFNSEVKKLAEQPIVAVSDKQAVSNDNLLIVLPDKVVTVPLKFKPTDLCLTSSHTYIASESGLYAVPAGAKEVVQLLDKLAIRSVVTSGSHLLLLTKSEVFQFDPSSKDCKLLFNKLAGSQISEGKKIAMSSTHLLAVLDERRVVLLEENGAFKEFGGKDSKIENARSISFDQANGRLLISNADTVVCYYYK